MHDEGPYWQGDIRRFAEGLRYFTGCGWTAISDDEVRALFYPMRFDVTRVPVANAELERVAGRIWA